MRLRCRVCGAWRLGDRVILPTALTTLCTRCGPRRSPVTIADEPVSLEAKYTLLRHWLRAAPVFDDGVLAAARAAHRGRVDTPVPWADTLDLDVAAKWFYDRRLTALLWPPANDDARFRLMASLHDDPLVAPLDVGAAFGQRGFPYPPDNTRFGTNPRGYRDVVDRDDVSVKVDELWAWVQPGPPGTQLSGGLADVVPAQYHNVLTIELIIRLLRDRRGPDPLPRWYAVGSIYRENPDRVVVLWR